MIKQLAIGCVLLGASTCLAQGPDVRIEAPQLQGSRTLEKQTGSSVIRDYLQSWNSMQKALDHNQVSALDPDFIGTAREKLAATIDSQLRSGIHTRYQDRSHDIQIIFYSPDGLSIQLTDDVQYEEKVATKDKSLVTKIVHEHYLVVMTPSEVRWQVRIFQGNPT